MAKTHQIRCWCPTLERWVVSSVGCETSQRKKFWRIVEPFLTEAHVVEKTEVLVQLIEVETGRIVSSVNYYE